MRRRIVNEAADDLSRRVADLRHAFDQGFAAPRRDRFDDADVLIAFGIAGDAYAVPVRAIAGIAEADRLVPVPSRSPHLLGLAAVRGALVPVFSLAGLIGYDRREGRGRWMVLCGTDDVFALALGNIQGYLSVPKSGPSGAGRDARTHIERIIGDDGAGRAVIDIASIATTIRDGAVAAPAGSGS